MRFVAFLRRYENQYTRSRDFTHLDGARETKNMTKKGKKIRGVYGENCIFSERLIR